MEKRKLNLLTGLSAALLIAVGPSIASWLSGPSVGSVMAASLPSISGVVKDDAGKPLRGVTVTATSGSGFRNVTGLTDRAGRIYGCDQIHNRRASRAMLNVSRPPRSWPLTRP